MKLSCCWLLAMCRGYAPHRCGGASMDQTRQPMMMSYPLRSKEKPHILALRMAELKYRGRAITEDHLLYVRQLIADHPQASRRTLSKKLCEAWQWRQANGALSDMVCRSLLVLLERAGAIQLPPVKYIRHNPLARRARPKPRLIDSTPIEGELRELGPVDFQLVRRTGEEPLFNSLVEQHHYIGYEQPVGGIRSGRNRDPLPVWLGRVRRAISVHATATSAGVRKHGGAMFVSSPITHVS
jgi:hypothetical protein